MQWHCVAGIKSFRINIMFSFRICALNYRLSRWLYCTKKWLTFFGVAVVGSGRAGMIRAGSGASTWGGIVGDLRVSRLLLEEDGVNSSRFWMECVVCRFWRPDILLQRNQREGMNIYVCKWVETKVYNVGERPCALITCTQKTERSSPRYT